MDRHRGQVKAQQRYVRPYHNACVDNQCCLFGFDVNRKAMRTFMLARRSTEELWQRYGGPMVMHDAGNVMRAAE